VKKTNPHTRNRRAFGISRLAIGVASVAGGLTLLLTPLGASGQEVTASDVPSVITVTQTPSGVTGDCVDPAAAILNGTLVAYPLSDANVFQLTVHASAPLCAPITAKAVVYAMPATGEWPQTLVEAKDITILDAGDTVITFAKGCDRVQYDVITGAAPAIINTGFDQSLLFPGNLDTAFQHVGNGPGCVENATSTAPSTTAPPTTAVVLGTTTIKDPTTTIPAAVLAATTVPGSSNTAADGLAVTGTTSGPFALMGGGLVFIGLAFMLASRRRTA
jgi:hypothetical protein